LSPGSACSPASTWPRLAAGERQVAGWPGAWCSWSSNTWTRLVAAVPGHLEVAPGEVAEDRLEDVADHQAAGLGWQLGTQAGPGTPSGRRWPGGSNRARCPAAPTRRSGEAR
jgi:hypothetical protein